jgi:hypothetical protein
MIGTLLVIIINSHYYALIFSGAELVDTYTNIHFSDILPLDLYTLNSGGVPIFAATG